MVEKPVDGGLFVRKVMSLQLEESVCMCCGSIVEKILRLKKLRVFHI
jgi:hypothetical protein